MQVLSGNVYFAVFLLLGIIGPLPSNSQGIFWGIHDPYNPLIRELPRTDSSRLPEDNQYRQSPVPGPSSQNVHYDQLSRVKLQESYGGNSLTKVADQKDEKILLDRNKNGVLSNGTVERKKNIGGTIPEETDRTARQVKKNKPGFFWTLARLAFETYNDTHSAVQQIGQLINANIAPEMTTRKQLPSGSLTIETTTTKTATDQTGNSSNETSVSVTTPATTTTTEPYRLSRSQLQGLIRRNLRGLVRLFNIEWTDALNQSDTSIREFQRDLGNQVGIYLKDNPNAY